MKTNTKTTTDVSTTEKKEKRVRSEVKFTQLSETVRKEMMKLENRLAVYYKNSARAKEAINNVVDQLVREADNDDVLSRACGRFVESLPKDAATIAGLDLNLTLFGKLNPSKEEMAEKEKEFEKEAAKAQEQNSDSNQKGSDSDESSDLNDTPGEESIKSDDASNSGNSENSSDQQNSSHGHSNNGL